MIQAAGIKIAVAGGVAANAYMPPRHTANLDLAIHKDALERAAQALGTVGWTFLGNGRGPTP